MEQIHNRKIKNELENVICFKTIVDKMVGIHGLVDQFKVTVNGLETAVEEAYENKKIMTEIMEVSEDMKNRYYLQMTEDQRQFTEQIRKNVSEIDQLKADASAKAIEVNELEKRHTNQQLCIDLHQEMMTRIEKYIANMVHTIQYYNLYISYILLRLLSLIDIIMMVIGTLLYASIICSVEFVCRYSLVCIIGRYKSIQ